MPDTEVPVIIFSLPSTVTLEVKGWSAKVMTWFWPIVKATLPIVKEGMVAIPFMAGSVMLPAVMLAISNFTVSLAFSIFVVITFTDETPAKCNAPCIWAIRLPAKKVAKARVRIFFIFI